MPTSSVAEDKESLSRSRDRLREMQNLARGGGVEAMSKLTKKQVFGMLAGLKEMDAIQIFFIGVSGFKDLVDFLLGIMTFDTISVVDWLIDLPLLVFVIFIAAVLVLSNPSSINTIILGFTGPIAVGLAEISPLGIFPFYLGFAIWLVATINNSKKEKKEKDQDKEKASSADSTNDTDSSKSGAEKEAT